MTMGCDLETVVDLKFWKKKKKKDKKGIKRREKTIMGGGR